MQETKDHLKVLGRVTEAVHEIYMVESDTSTIPARLSGRLRHNKIQILVGDYVEVRISPYDLSHGQIVRRMSENDMRRMGQPSARPFSKNR